MNAREQYIEQLKKYLKGLSQADRDDAIDFYSEYIDDAGLTTVKEIVDKLGTPEQLSTDIIAKTTGSQPNGPASRPVNYVNDRRTRTILYICLAVVLIIFLGPLALGLLLGFFGLIIGGLASIFGLGIGAFALAGSLFATDVWGAIFYCGGGIALLGLLIIFVAIVVWAIKWLCRGCKNFARYLRNKSKEGA